MLSRCESPGALSSLTKSARLVSPLLDVTSLDEVVGLPILGALSLLGLEISIDNGGAGSAILKLSGNSTITWRLRATAPHRRKAWLASTAKPPQIRFERFAPPRKVLAAFRHNQPGRSIFESAFAD